MLDMDQYSWIAEEQRTDVEQLVAALGWDHEWPKHFDELLEQHWGYGWSESVPDSEKQEHLAQVITAALEEHGVYSPAPQARDVRELGWVRDDQGSRLDALAHDDWHSWLPPELTQRWAGWVDSSPDELAGWLDELLHEFETSHPTDHEQQSTTDWTGDQADQIDLSEIEVIDLSEESVDLEDALWDVPEEVIGELIHEGVLVLQEID